MDARKQEARGRALEEILGAQAPQALRTLDGQLRKLTDQDLLICAGDGAEDASECIVLADAHLERMRRELERECAGIS
mgnify:CR=1 FL=1